MTASQLFSCIFLFDGKAGSCHASRSFELLIEWDNLPLKTYIMYRVPSSFVQLERGGAATISRSLWSHRNTTRIVASELPATRRRYTFDAGRVGSSMLRLFATTCLSWLESRQRPTPEIDEDALDETPGAWMMTAWSGGARRCMPKGVGHAW